MRIAVLLLALLLAGCASPEPTGPPTGPVALGDRQGLFLVDVETHQVQVLAEKPALAWLSPNASLVSWTDADFSIIVDRTTGARNIGQQVFWARVYENGTGLELLPGEARWRNIVSGTVLGNATLPPPPVANARWSFASDDLSALGSETLRATARCGNDIYLRATENQRTQGCHLRIAGDGRIGWAEAGNVRLLSREGARSWINASANEALENPIFSADHVIHLRVNATGSAIVDETGKVYATVGSATRLALHDVSADGRYILARGFNA